MRVSSCSKNPGLAAAAFLIYLTTPLTSPGATANVSVVNNVFSPAATNIFVNDTVLWTWPSGSVNHNVTSTKSPQAWTASATVNGPTTFSHTFTTTGSFPYSCTLHAGLGMVGSVTVATAVIPNLPPTISVISPTNGAVLAAPASVTIQTTPADSDGSVTNVQFLLGTTVISNRPVAPFIATTNNLAAGTYTISAIVSDNLGAKGTNSVAFSVVSPAPLAISSLTAAAGSVQFSYAANIGLSYVVQKNTSLASSNWISLATNQAKTSPVVFVDPHATNNPAFYRVGRLPNP